MGPGKAREENPQRRARALESIECAKGSYTVASKPVRRFQCRGCRVFALIRNDASVPRL